MELLQPVTFYWYSVGQWRVSRNGTFKCILEWKFSSNGQEHKVELSSVTVLKNWWNGGNCELWTQFLHSLDPNYYPYPYLKAARCPSSWWFPACFVAKLESRNSTQRHTICDVTFQQPLWPPWVKLAFELNNSHLLFAKMNQGEKRWCAGCLWWAYSSGDGSSLFSKAVMATVELLRLLIASTTSAMVLNLLWKSEWGEEKNLSSTTVKNHWRHISFQMISQVCNRFWLGISFG